MILNFNQIKKDNVIMAGGKGANLGELVSIGLNVPAGFVITSDVYKSFIEENGIGAVIVKKLTAAKNDKAMLLKAAKHFRDLIKNGKFNSQIKSLIERYYAKLGDDVSVAVRSSATAEDLPDASFAGQQETYLNVRGIDAIYDQIRNCYASLWNDRAVVYRTEQSYDHANLAIAVVIQTMVDSEKSGVLFTVNPVDEKQNEVLINANFGLGESVVSGRVTADTYVVAKSGKILDFNIGNKELQTVCDSNQTKEIAIASAKRRTRVLSDDEIVALLQTALKIETHYCYPVDIEWAISNRIIYILQARAITTLKNNGGAQNRKIPAYVKNVKVKKRNRELMSFLVEKIPFAFRALEFDYFTAISEQKMTISAENGITLSPNLVMNDEGLMSISRENMALNRNIYKLLGTLKSLNDYDYCAKACRQFLNEYSARVNQYKALDFTQMSFAECKSFLINSYQLTKDISYKRFKFAVIPSVLDKSLAKAVKKVNAQYSSFDLYWGLAYRTAQVAQEIANIAHFIDQNSILRDAVLSGLDYYSLCQQFDDFKRLTDDFLNAHGYTVDYVSYCVEGKSFIEDPDRIIKLLKPQITKDNTITNRIEERDYNELTKALKVIYGKKYSKLENKINHFRYFHYVREEGQYLYEIIDFYLRRCLERMNALLLGNKDYRQGIANLFYDELIMTLNNKRISDLEVKKIKIRNKNLPFANSVWNASKLVLYNNKGASLHGISGNSGVVVARVCVVKNPAEFYKMQKGDVLVCPFTAPEWTSLFKLASAVVADTGSALSHAAIVAREYGIPAVLGVGFATSTFKDGDMIKVDGDNAKVTGV